MSNSLEQHGIKEVYKQLRLRMKSSNLDTVKVHVTRRAGKYKYNFYWFAGTSCNGRKDFRGVALT